MQNLRKNKNKVITTQMMNLTNEEAIDTETCDEMNRGCKGKPNNMYNNNNCGKQTCNECEPCHNHIHDHDKCIDPCKKPHKPEKCCETCEDTLSQNCIKNTCDTNSCCSPLNVPRVSVANATPFAIDANRIFDTIQFQTFQDASGTGLDYTYEVIEVSGMVPRSGQGKVTVEEICFNFDEMIIYPGNTSLEGYTVEEVTNDVPCESNFDYTVCGERNRACCSRGLGTTTRYRQRGLTIQINGLEIILKCKCGCTKINVLVVPNSNNVVFNYNTLSAQMCVPSDGNSFTLRQNYQTQLSVGCVGTGLISKECVNGCTTYNFELPGGLDLVLCLQEIVSILKQEQVVVLGSTNQIQPRVVDNFAKVCNFSQCGGSNTNTSAANTQNNSSNNCNCHR